MKKFYFLVVAIFLFGSANGQIIEFGDATFKAKLLLSTASSGIALNSADQSIVVDANGNNEIEISEALLVITLNISNSPISSLSGIEYFSNLKKLTCQSNYLVNLDLIALSNLEELDCRYSNVASLIVTGLSNLKSLNCMSNNLTTLNLLGLSSLEYLCCNYNDISSVLNLHAAENLQTLLCYSNELSDLNVSPLIQLKYFQCSENNISNLNLTGLYNLEFISCQSNNMQSLNLAGCFNIRQVQCSLNQIAQLNLSQQPLLTDILCYNNNLSTLDLSHCNAVQVLSCNDNPSLQTINIKNGVALTDFSNFYMGNTDLQHICADEDEITPLFARLTASSITDCEVNSYCTFTPGGEYFAVAGNSKIDNNSNGCDVNDIGYPNLYIQIMNNSNNETLSYISRNDGTHYIPVGAGSYLLTPALENNYYFSISPSSVNIDFPTQISPLAQNFCIIANGDHSDLEISVLPLSIARPGFDAKYKLIYRNIGNQTQSGTVNFTFNDALLDFVSSIPVATQSLNTLAWDFANLQPFESREIMVVVNVNSPMEVPPVNGGDQLSYTAAVNSDLSDETPQDNTFVFNQTVVNSFDPNDKTCLEGATITPEMVGKYVHYMIRFENTGTANAENIVVKDMIDTAKFDINSLIPIDGSHPFVTRISSTNKVEFIFENINLPFDDANNDGYVAFKIKTKPTLVLGDTFSNTANIYFDYNFPIITNTATTTITALAKHDFAFDNYFRIYPNPSETVLNIDSKKQIEVSSISIYNTLGQLVLVIPNAQNVATVDVSSLKSGNYFIKVNSDKGTSNAKFMKK